MNYKNKGITLIALVITIIILLILVGITINSLTAHDIFDNAKLAKDKWQNKQKEENNLLLDYENNIDTYLGMSRNNIDLTLLYETDTASSFIALSESFKNFKFLCFVHTDSSSFTGIRTDFIPVSILNQVQNKNVEFSIDGYGNQVANVVIESNTQFKISSGNEKIYSIYGIK